MNEIFLAECEDCGDKIEVISPATFTCNKCGCGTFKFKQTMVFECFHKHIHVGKKTNPNCEKCLNAERTMWRTFKLSRQIGDGTNRMPEDKKVEKKVIRRKKKATVTKSGLKRRKKK